MGNDGGEVLTGEEQKTASNSATDTLCKKDLVVVVGDRSHHEAKDMQDRAEKYRPSRSYVIAHSACDDSLTRLLGKYGISIPLNYNLVGDTKLTQKNNINDSVDGIHEMVPGEYNFSWWVS